MTRRNKAAYRKRAQNRFSMALVFLVVAMLVIFIEIRGMELQQKIDAKAAELAQLEAQIAEEDARAARIEEFGKEVQTKGYIEKIARERLGLVYEGEILFKQDK